MENKYYDLIISLIKNHRKYPGLESILEDIANDVIEQSKVVVSTVTNEDVVKAYLEKIISTSIIRVSKKMNLNTRIRNRVQESLPVETTIVNSEISELDVPREIVDEADVIENDSEQENEQLELEVVEFFEEDNTDSLTENPVELEEVFLDDDIETLGAVEVVEPSTEEEVVEDLDVSNSTEDVDRTLVDKMINGVSTPESLVLESVDEILSEEVDEVYETLEEVEPIVGDVEGNLELVEESSFDDVETSLIEETSSSEVMLEIDTQESTSDIEDVILQHHEDVQLESFPDENQEMVVEDDLELLINEAEFVEESALEDGLEFDLDLAGEELLLESEVEQEEEQVISGEFQSPNFECFSFNPEKTDCDIEEILSELNNIEEKHPERKIIKICELKYSRNLSVSEIAEIVGFSEEQVLDVLSEIIEIVKD